MQDEKLQRLHDTLEKLRPKGRTGGLGFGAGFGPKKKDDNLPKNGLYAFFVRAGEGGYKKWDQDETEKEEEATSTKKSKEKKRKITADNKEEDQPLKKRRQVTEQLDFPWVKHIRSALKQTENKQMPLKHLQKHVITKALEHHQSRGEVTLKKKTLKKAFKEVVQEHDALTLDDGLVTYNSKKKKEKTEDPTTGTRKKKKKASTEVPKVVEEKVVVKPKKKDKKIKTNYPESKMKSPERKRRKKEKKKHI